MKKVLALAALVMGACGVAQAGDFYVAGDVAKTRYSGGGSDQGFSLAGGYQFNKNWAAELGYRFIGSDTKSYTEGANKWTESYRFRSIDLSAIGTLPLTDQFSVFGRLGYGTLQVKESYAVTAGSAPTSYRGSGTDSGLIYGLGADYALTKQLSVRGEYQRVASNVSVLALGLKYGF